MCSVLVDDTTPRLSIGANSALRVPTSTWTAFPDARQASNGSATLSRCASRHAFAEFVVNRAESWGVSAISRHHGRRFSPGQGALVT